MKLTQEQIEILEDGRIEWNKFYLQGQLDRKQYLSINEVLETIGLKWNRKEKAHIFDGDMLEEAIAEIIESGECETLKETIKKFQFYPTPREVSEYLVDLADIQDTDTVLEPSAWEWHLVDVILPKLKDTKNQNCAIVLLELDQSKVAILKEKYSCYGGMKDVSDWLGTYSKDNKMNIFQGDFLEMDFNPFEKIIMNPPFAKSQDVKHILHAYSMLAKGGTLVSVASSSIQWREGELYEKLKDLDPEFLELPAWSFKEYGTMVNSVIVVLRK